jgi:hypothetical protein
MTFYRVTYTDNGVEREAIVELGRWEEFTADLIDRGITAISSTRI